MSAAAVTRRVQHLLLAGLGFLLAWQVLAVVDAPRSARVVLGLQGFVFHVIFAKAYALVPSYFARELALPSAPAVQLPLSGLGVVGLAAAGLGAPAVVGVAGALLWLGGVAVFVGALAWTVRGNPTGAETGTGEAKSHRRGVDRYANAFVPVVLAYLLVAAYHTAAAGVGWPGVVGGGPAATHLLAAGAATLLLLAVGVRLLPRLLVATPPRPLVWIALPAGALGPALLAGGFAGAGTFLAGAALEAVAVASFAAAYAVTYARADRRRVGAHAVLAGVAAGLAGVGLGLDFALRGPAPALADAHVRLTLLGFLGLAIVGAGYHFYPPGVGRFPGAGDRSALATLALLAGGLAVEVVGLASGAAVAVGLGRVAALVGAAGFGYLVLGVLVHQRGDWASRGGDG